VILELEVRIWELGIGTSHDGSTTWELGFETLERVTRKRIAEMGGRTSKDCNDLGGQG
jgi:hypothetical protein